MTAKSTIQNLHDTVSILPLYFLLNIRQTIAFSETAKNT